MKFYFKEKEKLDLGFGDIMITSSCKYLVVDSSYSDQITKDVVLINLETNKYTCSYDSLEDVIKTYKIDRIIKSRDISLREE